MTLVMRVVSARHSTSNVGTGVGYLETEGKWPQNSGQRRQDFLFHLDLVSEATKAGAGSWRWPAEKARSLILGHKCTWRLCFTLAGTIACKNTWCFGDPETEVAFRFFLAWGPSETCFIGDKTETPTVNLSAPLASSAATSSLFAACRFPSPSEKVAAGDLRGLIPT